MEKLDAIRAVKTELMNCSKVANFISTNTGIVDVTSLQLTTIPRKNIFVTVDLTTDERFRVSDPNITQYDLAVMDAAYTLGSAGFPAFTPEMIVRTMSGNLGQDATDQKIKAVKKSINKLRVILIRIDCTEELVARKKIKKGESARLETYLLPVNKIDVTLVNNKIVTGYKFIEQPALYEYAEKINQIISVPVSLLETKGSVNDTDDAVLIKRYLIKRIESMKNQKNRISSKKISYEWYDKNTKSTKGMIAELALIKSTDGDLRKRKFFIHKTVKTILACFVEEGYICSFKETKDGHKITGVEIEL